jgi:hypothetical protein
MDTYIDKYCSNSDVSFAHCISADFDNQKKNMSQGVATVFRDKFGRPSEEDYCSTSIFKHSQNAL